MRTLYIDCGMGAAGDMLTAALYEILDDREKRNFIETINSLCIPDISIVAEKSVKCGIVGTHMKVTICGVEEDSLSDAHEHGNEHNHEHDHDHDHDSAHSQDVHDHNHDHHHNGMEQIEYIINTINVNKRVKNNAISVYRLIAEAESHAHGVAITDIHFHEVGTMDAVTDVVAVCILLDTLQVDNIIASPIHVGSGHVHCAHGILPVPAPATAYILRDVPIYGGGIKGELCTPTGAALLKYFVASFGEMPAMTVQKIGYGMGRKDFEAANCVRAMLGDTLNVNNKICELSCNLDDMTPERIGFASELLFEAGALEVYTVPVNMKKSRPGILLCVMCSETNRDDIVNLIFRHTTTLGIRENISRRYTMKRNISKISTPAGEVRIKHSEGYGVSRDKYEYDDLARIAREKSISIESVVRLIEENEQY